MNIDTSFILGMIVGIIVSIAVIVYTEESSDETSCEELSKQLIPYRHCLQEGGRCAAGVDFFIEYYDIKWQLESRCPNTPR